MTVQVHFGHTSDILHRSHTRILLAMRLKLDNNTIHTTLYLLLFLEIFDFESRTYIMPIDLYIKSILQVILAVL